MSLTPSTMLELGTPATEFSLPTPDGEICTFADMKIDKWVLVVFMCNHCPYVKHIREKLVGQTRKLFIIAVSLPLPGW